MSLSRALYLASRGTRDVEVLIGPNGTQRYLKRRARRVIHRRAGRSLLKLERDFGL